MRSLPPAGGSSIPTPSRCAASRSESLIGRSASGVCASPCSRIAPLRAQRRRALERHHHVGRGDAVAGQQVADEPRARELARDVVVQVRVQPAVARVELRRGADREHRRVEQVEPERRRGPAASRSSASDTESPRAQLQRPVVGDVEAAERVGRVRVARRDALDRRHDAAVDEVEADGGGRRHGAQATSPATASASLSIASPGCDTVSGPLVDEPRCCTTWASSCAISLSPDAEPGLYSPFAK